MGEIKVRVVPAPERAGELAGETLLEKLEARIDELGESIGEIARRLRSRLDAELTKPQPGTELAPPEPEWWTLDEVVVKFSLDLEAEAGVVVAKARTTAGFEVELAWKRS